MYVIRIAWNQDKYLEGVASGIPVEGNAEGGCEDEGEADMAASCAFDPVFVVMSLKQQVQ